MLSTRKRVGLKSIAKSLTAGLWMFMASKAVSAAETPIGRVDTCLLYTSDAADE